MALTVSPSGERQVCVLGKKGVHAPPDRADTTLGVDRPSEYDVISTTGASGGAGWTETAEEAPVEGEKARKASAATHCNAMAR